MLRGGHHQAMRDDDWDDCRALWGGYLAFYRDVLPEETSGATFRPGPLPL